MDIGLNLWGNKNMHL